VVISQASLFLNGCFSQNFFQTKPGGVKANYLRSAGQSLRGLSAELRLLNHISDILPNSVSTLVQDLN